MSGSGPLRTAAVWVWTAALAVAAALLVVRLPHRSLTGADAVLLPGLAVLVGAAEFLQVRFRVGRHVDGSNLVEAAVAPLLVVAPSLPGVAAVAAGQLLAATVRRNAVVKGAFNTAQWSLATAVGAAVFTSLRTDPASWSGAGSLVVAVLAVGLVNLLSFTVVLLLTGSDLRAVRPMVGLGWLAGLGVNTSLGLLFALAHQATPWGLLLAPVPLVVLHLAYRGYAAARADRARLAGMHRAASVLTGPLDPRPVIPDFLRAAAEVFETRCAVMVIKVEGGREIHSVETSSGAAEVHEEAEDVASFAAAMAAHLGAVRVDARDEGPLSAALREAGHRDCLAAPVLDGGRVLGALMLLDQVGIEGASAGQLSVLEALAREVAAALAKGRLLDSVLEERRKLSTVVTATSDGIASLGEDGVVRSWNPALETITGLSEDEVVGRADGLGRLDARTPSGHPVDLAGWSVDGALLPEELSVRSGSGGRRRLACSYSHAEDERGRVLVVVARDVTPVQEFEALRAEFGRLVEQEAARRLVVEQLQAAVVPDTPVVEGLELAVTYVASDPKEPTGGDLWDWHVLPTGELHVAVVDVLGHGVAATKSALSVVHVLRALALDDTPLERLVGRAAELLERQDSELVATVVVGRLDPGTGRLRVVSGGHPPALVVSADGSAQQVTATGGVIGWPGAGSDGVTEIVLEDGDTLLLYTDGLVEARKDIVAGIDALTRELSSVATMPVALMTEELVGRALAGADRRDDTLALVVRRGGSVVEGPHEPRPSGRWQITPVAHEAQQVRREVVRWLHDRGVPPGNTALVVAELLANAIRAARSVVVLELSLSMGCIHLVVSDDGAGLEELPDEALPSLESEGGRGLFMVRRLSLGVELVPDTRGTTIRCWLPVEGELDQVDLEEDPEHAVPEVRVPLPGAATPEQ